MNEDDVRLSLAIFLSIPFMFLTYYILALFWPVLFPYSSQILPYASKFASPVHLVLPIAGAIFFYILLKWLDEEKIMNGRSVGTLLLLTFIVFLAYYVGVGGFYFYNYLNGRLIELMFTYFLYVPYWTILGGLFSAWLSYWIPPRFLRWGAHRSKQ